MVLGASRTVALAGFIVAQASQLVASADAVAVARFRGRLDGNERHGKESYGFQFLVARDRHPSALERVSSLARFLGGIGLSSMALAQRRADVFTSIQEYNSDYPGGHPR